MAAVLAVGACKLVAPPQASTGERTEAARPDCPVCPKIVQSSSTDDSFELLDYYQQLTEFSKQQLRNEYRELESAGQSTSPDNRLRLALLLSLPQTEFSDDARASELLSSYLQEDDAGNSNEQAFAQFLQDALEERQRRQQELKAVKQKLADAQARRKDLERQLEQLKEIEQHMQNREDSLIVPIIEDDAKEKPKDEPKDEIKNEAEDPAGR